MEGQARKRATLVAVLVGLGIGGVIGALVLSSGALDQPTPTMTQLGYSDAVKVSEAELALIRGGRGDYEAADDLIAITRASPCAVDFTEGFGQPRTMREVLRENAGYAALPRYEVEDVLAELPDCPNPRTDRSWEGAEREP